MPSVKKQVAVYEKNIALGKNQKNPPIAPQFKNVQADEGEVNFGFENI